MIEKMLCFFLGHEIPTNIFGFYHLPASEEWPCRRCGEDGRPSWVIQMDMEDRLEALVLKAMGKK